MAGIVAVVGLDGSRSAALHAMLGTMNARGVAGASADLDGASLGAVDLGIAIDREAAVAAILDGRLDNQSALTSELRLPDTASDGDVLIGAYRRWGLAAAAHLLGDFAFALWDARARTLVCGRDFLGVKPLYYRAWSQQFACASSLRPLIAMDGGCDVNETMACEYLSAAITSAAGTLYTGVLRVPPAHVLAFNDRGARAHRYWDPTSLPDVRYSRDGDYAERLGELLTESVRCRLRGARRPGVLLSGGLDSSAVVATAAGLRDSAGVGPVMAVSNIFPGRDCDEQRYIDGVLTYTHVDSIRCVPPVVSPERVDEDARLFGDFPTYPNIATTDAARRLARAHGVDVLLTGEGGDEWLSGSYYRYADLLRSGRLVALARAWHDDRALAAAGTIEFPSHRLLRLGVWPNAPARLRRAARALRGHSPQPFADWLVPEFGQLIAGRREPAPARQSGESFSHAHTRAALGRAVDLHYLELMERSAVRFGIDERHPLHDRRIIEYALGIPDTQLWQRRPKEVLRRAMAGRLPQSIRDRLDKAYLPHTYADAIVAGGGESIAATLHPWVAERVNLARFRMMLRSVTERYTARNERYTEHIWPCWMVYGLSRWMCTVADGAVRDKESVHA